LLAVASKRPELQHSGRQKVWAGDPWKQQALSLAIESANLEFYKAWPVAGAERLEQNISRHDQATAIELCALKVEDSKPRWLLEFNLVVAARCTLLSGVMTLIEQPQARAWAGPEII